MENRDNTLVNFVIPTYDRIDNLQSTLSALICQTNPSWRALVVVDGQEHSSKIRDMIIDLKDNRINMFVLDKRYNDWGHTPRELGKQMTTAKYVIMTGDDNYYVPTFVEELQKAVNSTDADIVYWDMVHSHYGYMYFKCTLGYNQIDIGAFAVKTDLAKQIKLNTSYAADGEFIEEFKIKFPNFVPHKINKVLYVHN